MNSAIAPDPAVPLTPALVDLTVIYDPEVKVNRRWPVWVAVAFLVLGLSGVTYALSRSG